MSTIHVHYINSFETYMSSNLIFNEQVMGGGVKLNEHNCRNCKYIFKSGLSSQSCTCK